MPPSRLQLCTFGESKYRLRLDILKGGICRRRAAMVSTLALYWLMKVVCVPPMATSKRRERRKEKRGSWKCLSVKRQNESSSSMVSEGSSNLTVSVCCDPSCFDCDSDEWQTISASFAFPYSSGITLNRRPNLFQLFRNSHCSGFATLVLFTSVFTLMTGQFPNVISRMAGNNWR